MRTLLAMIAAAAAGLTFTAGAASAKPAGEPFRDCENCPELMPLAPGAFTMGASLEEEASHGLSAPIRGRSFPLRRVTFRKGFAMGRYPVTVAQYRAFVDETGYKGSDGCYNQRYYDGHFIYERALGYTWRSPGYQQDDRHPVVCVSGEDGEAYAAWLSRKTGKSYALPNEAQYEYALRAGTTTSFFWGTDQRDARACEYSNQPDLEQGRAMGDAPMGPAYRFQCSDGYAWTSPVGSFKPNPWGLYDMQGNIWEWAADCWNENFTGAPTDGSTWMTGDCDARPSRGGSFGNAAHSAYAGVRAPRHMGYNGHSWGFRVVRND